MRRFLTELRRRNVLRVAAAYALSSWIIIEAGSVLLPTFGASEQLFRLYVIVVIAGFVAAVVLSWMFEWTPEGVKLLSASSEAAVIEYKGQKQTLGLGQGTRVAVAAQPSRSGQVVLQAERGGHFFADGWINGSGAAMSQTKSHSPRSQTRSMMRSEMRRMSASCSRTRRGVNPRLTSLR